MAWEKEGKTYYNEYGNVKCKIRKGYGYWGITCIKPRGTQTYIDTAKTLKAAKTKAPRVARRAKTDMVRKPSTRSSRIRWNKKERW